MKSIKHLISALAVVTALTVLPAFSAPADQAALALANTRFGFDLLKQISDASPGSNVFISPFSVSSVLQIVASGAAGRTRDEMQRVLHLTGRTDQEAAFKSLNQALTGGQNDVILNLANSIWYKQGAELKPEFAARGSNVFQAALSALNFANPQSAKVINDWAEQNTQGRIKDIIQPPINPLTRVILANAVYFKGHWARPFDKNATKDRAFTLGSGSQAQVPMMQQQGRFDYCQSPGFQAVRLPYAGGRLQMCLFLPDSGTSIHTMLAGFDGSSWQGGVLSQLRQRQGTVVLPRFKLDFAILLNQPLAKLGMKSAFTAAADFSGMSAEKLLLSEVKQKSFVEVNEEGTEAAAVTTGTMRATAVMRPEKPFELVLDHPFFFVINDATTRSILFMGIVSDPGAGRQ